MIKTPIPQIIDSCGFCRAEEVKKLRVIKAGMTNRSYSFYVQDKRYMTQIHGEAPANRIDCSRKAENYRPIWKARMVFKGVLERNDHIND